MKGPWWWSSGLTLYSVDSSSNPAEAQSFPPKMLSENTKINNKEAWVGTFKK